MHGIRHFYVHFFGLWVEYNCKTFIVWTQKIASSWDYLCIISVYNFICNPVLESVQSWSNIGRTLGGKHFYKCNYTWYWCIIVLFQLSILYSIFWPQNHFKMKLCLIFHYNFILKRIYTLRNILVLTMVYSVVYG